MDISETVKEIQKQKKGLNSLEKNVKQYIKIEKITVDDILKSGQILTKIEINLENLMDAKIKQEIKLFIHTEKRANEEKLQHLERVFGKQLNDELQKNELRLEGRLPKTRVGYYGLEIFFRKNECKIHYGINEDEIGRIKLDPVNIAKYITDTERGLENKSLDPSLLLKAYHKIVPSKKTELTKRAPIIKLLHQVAIDKQNSKFTVNPTKSNYKEYSRIQFSHDLYKLKRDKKIRLRLITANRAQVRNKQDYLWVPSSKSKGSVYSSIEIMEEQ